MFLYSDLGWTELPVSCVFPGPVLTLERALAPGPQHQEGDHTQMLHPVHGHSGQPPPLVTLGSPRLCNNGQFLKNKSERVRRIINNM